VGSRCEIWPMAVLWSCTIPLVPPHAKTIGVWQRRHGPLTARHPRMPQGSGRPGQGTVCHRGPRRSDDPARGGARQGRKRCGAASSADHPDAGYPSASPPPTPTWFLASIGHGGSWYKYVGTCQTKGAWQVHQRHRAGQGRHMAQRPRVPPYRLRARYRKVYRAKSGDMGTRRPPRGAPLGLHLLYTPSLRHATSCCINRSQSLSPRWLRERRDACCVFQ
jgi:hypothetical protein